MKRGFVICLLVFGLTHAEEDNVASETKVGMKATSGNINFRSNDKRGETKITNTDNPSLNHLTTTNTVSEFKPSTSYPQQVRYLYSQQYYQLNPYLTYVQLPQATQIASQYSVQTSPVSHFLQTPNQIQYVAAPTVAQVPQINYQTFSKEYSSANAVASDFSSGTDSQYVPQTQQTTQSQIYVPSSSSATVYHTGQVQVPFSGYQPAQPVYYTQQPLFTYFPQAKPSSFIYQQPNANCLLKQQQQLANLHGANRFGLYIPTQKSQLTYLVPMAVSQPQQHSTTTASGVKSSEKTVSATQQQSSSNSFTYRTKA